MQAGTYYVGDLCYVMHPQWDEVCEITRDLEGEFTLANGVKFAIYYTKYGDGAYFDQNGLEYSVDSGTLGCIMVENIQDDTAHIENLGNIIKFDREFVPFNENGIIHFGSMIIDTSSDWDDDVDPDLDEEEEEEPIYDEY